MGDAKILVKILGKKKERREIFLPKVGNEAEKREFPQHNWGGQRPAEQCGVPYSLILFPSDLTAKVLQVTAQVALT